MPKRRPEANEAQEPITIVPIDRELEVPAGLPEAVDHLRAFVEGVVYDHAAETPDTDADQMEDYPADTE